MLHFDGLLAHKTLKTVQQASAVLCSDGPCPTCECASQGAVGDGLACACGPGYPQTRKCRRGCLRGPNMRRLAMFAVGAWGCWVRNVRLPFAVTYVQPQPAAAIPRPPRPQAAAGCREREAALRRQPRVQCGGPTPVHMGLVYPAAPRPVAAAMAPYKSASARSGHVRACAVYTCAHACA